MLDIEDKRGRDSPIAWNDQNKKLNLEKTMQLLFNKFELKNIRIILNKEQNNLS